jgi:hypothetical protein
MKKIGLSLLTAATLLAGGTPQKFTGIVTDSMCGANHAMMHVTPDAKCVQDCVKAHAKYVLFDGKIAYPLSNQQEPAKFAAQRVTILGTMKDGAIEITSITPAK